MWFDRTEGGLGLPSRAATVVLWGGWLRMLLVRRKQAIDFILVPVQAWPKDAWRDDRGDYTPPDRSRNRSRDPFAVLRATRWEREEDRIVGRWRQGSQGWQGRGRGCSVQCRCIECACNSHHGGRSRSARRYEADCERGAHLADPGSAPRVQSCNTAPQEGGSPAVRGQHPHWHAKHHGASNRIPEPGHACSGACNVSRTRHSPPSWECCPLGLVERPTDLRFRRVPFRGGESLL